MAGCEGDDFAETPGWRMGLLLAGLLAITILWELIVAGLRSYLEHRKRRGLGNILKQLEREICALGVVSLFLAVVEEHLIKICISTDNASNDEEAPGPESYDAGHRRLLGESTSYSYGNETSSEGSGGCRAGYEPFWSATAIYQTHIFIFLLGATHILYAGVSLVLTLWKVERWKRWELSELEGHSVTAQRAAEQRHAAERRLTKRVNSLRSLPKPSSNWLSHYARAFMLQFTRSINAATYCALRRLFIERLKLNPDFNYHGFVVEALEEELSLVVQMGWVSWGMAVLWVSLPKDSYVFIWFNCIFFLVSLVCGTKLESVALQLSDMAYVRFRAAELERQRHPLSEATVKLQQWLKDTVNYNGMLKRDSRGAAAATLPGPGAATDVPPTAMPSLRRLSAPAVLLHQQQSAQQTRAALPSQMSTIRSLSPDRRTSLSPDWPAAIFPDNFASRPAASHWADLAASRGRDRAVDESPTAGHAVDVRVNASQEESGGKQPWYRKFVTSARNVSVNRVSRVSQPYSGHIEGATADSVEDTINAASFFWLGRPRIILFAYQLVYFANSLTVCVMLFGLWQDVTFGFEDLYNWVVKGLWIGIAVVNLLHSSLFILPVYALTLTVGSHCHQSVIQFALDNNIQPDKARAVAHLTRVSAGLEQLSTAPVDVCVATTHTPPTAQSVQQGDDDASTRSITSLLSAMYEAQLRKVQQMHQPQQGSPTNGDGSPAPPSGPPGTQHHDTPATTLGPAAKSPAASPAQKMAHAELGQIVGWMQEEMAAESEGQVAPPGAAATDVGATGMGDGQSSAKAEQQ